MPVPAHKTERWAKIMDFLEAHGGEVQRRQEQLAEDVGVPLRALVRHLARMEDLGVVQITRTSADFGVGRSPNTYTLVISVEQWEQEGPAIIKEYEKRRKVERAAQRARAKAEWAYETATRNLKQPPVIEPEAVAAASTEELEMAAATAAVVAEIDEKLEAEDPDALADAWAHGG